MSDVLKTERSFFFVSTNAKLPSILAGSMTKRSSSISMPPFDFVLLAAESVVLVSLVFDGFRRYFASISSDVSKIIP